MSDRSEFCAFYYKQTGQHAVWIRYEKRFSQKSTELAWKAWQAAQAQATVNQQLLEALESLLWAVEKNTGNEPGAIILHRSIDEARAAIFAAQEQSK